MDTENTATEQEQTNGGLESNSQLDGAGETHQVSVSESSNRVNVDDTASKTEAQGTHGEGVVAMEQENGRVYSGENNSVEVLSGLLKQHKSVYSQDCLSKHFNGDVLKVAGRCWEQIHESIQQALQSKYDMILNEFKVVDKLTELDRLKEETDPSQPAWRPSGIPDLDSSEAEGVELRTKIIPQFGVECEKVEHISSEVQRLLKERQKQLQKLERDIQHEMCQINSDIGVSM